MNKSKALVPFENPVKEMSYKKPEALANTHKTHITRINNAYNETTYFDNSGVMWIEANKLAEIIRTNNTNARYIISNNIPDQAKMYIGKTTYVRGYEIKQILDKFIQEEGIGKKKQYLKYSELLFNAIRDCDTAENIRTIYQNQLQDSRRKLKIKRIKKYKIKYDELTGENLIKKTAEFSHIRSYALFKNISDKIDNGLIVNKDIHQIITKKGVNDEEDLFKLCNENGWNVDWYQKFKINFINI